MRNIRRTLITGMVVAMALQPAYAKEKDKERDNGHGHGQEKAELVTERRAPAGQAKRLGQPATAHHAAEQIKNQVESMNRVASRQKEQLPRPDRHENRGNALLLKDAIRALENLEQARWQYNPNDTRGQGNNGTPDMLDPYGHDKDSDRMEQYGNRGRVIKESEPGPTPVPEPIPEPVPLPDPDPVPEPDPAPEPAPEPPPVPDPLPEPPPGYPPF